ncbi:hypothetical protein [Flagellimonas sp. GZD32]|uniref:hypothetical protein n=1 Tax=Flagellimonas cixiensis TaxID=3228750 RepID=UPI0035C8C841
MKLEIPFDENIYSEQTSLNFNLAWNENLKNNKKRLYWGIPSIIFGAFLTYQENYLGILFLGIGIHYGINFYDFYSHYKKNKTKYLELIKSEIDGQKSSNQDSIWEFNEEYFRYKYYKYDAKIKWNAFKSYRIIDKNLFLDLEVGNNSSYILGESEVGKEKFEEIIEFVKMKIK